MTVLHGEGVSRGLVRGTLRFFHRRTATVERQLAADPGAEVLRFDAARRLAVTQLGRLHDETAARLGAGSAVLFHIHQMLLEDPEYITAVTDVIRLQGVTAEYAVQTASEQLAHTFAQLETDYMRARSADMVDISRRVLRALIGVESAPLPMGEAAVLAADDLVPSETARLDASSVRAFITSGGSRSSHTAILARTLGIPAVIRLGDQVSMLTEGMELWVDGSTGEVFADPDDETVALLRDRLSDEAARRARLETYRNRPAVTRDGRRVLLCANIGNPGDLPGVQASGADGIGLFRSEFLYLGKRSAPTEEEQYAAYRLTLEAMGEKPVIIRTLDLGADKRADYFDLPREENPALGLRAIRLCFARPEVFRTQLRALYRASVHGNLSIMFPLIVSPWEVQKAKSVAAAVRKDLAAEGLPFRPDVPLGIMIETPAAALISDLLAKEADFFSIGTNDLIQYTLACDRQNGEAEPYCDRHHEAVLRLIRMTAEHARKAGVPVGVCGELAADPALTDFFLGIGVDELSMAPGAVLELRANILESEH